MRTLCIHLARRKRLSMAQLLPLEKAEDFCSGFWEQQRVCSTVPLHASSTPYVCTVQTSHGVVLAVDFCHDLTTQRTIKQNGRSASCDEPRSARRCHQRRLGHLSTASVKVMAGISRVSVSQGLIATQTCTSVPRTVTSSRESSTFRA